MSRLIILLLACMKTNCKLRIVIWIIVTSIIASCNNLNENANDLKVIDVESSIDKMEVVQLSQFSDKIRYVPLETREDIFFQGLWECIFSDSMILASDLNKCILLDLNGKFKARIGTKGRGPGEYNYLECAGFGADSNIFIQSSNWNLYEYKLDGSLVNQYDKIFRNDDNTYNAIARWIFIRDSLFFGHVANSNGLSKDKALMINKNGEIKKHYKNYILQKRERPTIGFFENFAHIIMFDKSVFYKEFFNDTLFHLDEDMNIFPRFVFNLGKYRLPDSFRLGGGIIDSFDYVTLWEVFQIRGYLFLRFDFGKWFPAKRLTHRPNPYVARGNPLWTNTVNVLGIFNKQTNTFVLCKPTDTDNPLFTSGLYNDIDCGPRFIPSEQVNDSTLVMKIDSKKLKDHIASDDFKNGIPKYPEKKRQLEELADKLTEFDNPVLMFVTLRK